MRSARRLLALTVGIAAIAAVGVAAPALAVILPAQTIDGPNENIVGFGGVAMAEDGTGGLVYLKRVEGIAHVFVSRYVEGHWLAPIRVDTEESFAASSPRIGAANGGELVVVWATPFATNAKGRTIDELLGADLGPGASLFGRAIIVAPSIGEGIGVSPDLAMSSTGQADVVYRIVEPDSTIPALHPGDVAEQVRVSRFDGERWSNLGTINRDTGVSMRPPTEANAPQIAIGPTGNAIVVWQEPEIENGGVARIWARRIFGSSVDFVLPVTATNFHGAPIVTEAEAPSVAISRLGQAEVAYRQTAGPGSRLPGPRVFVNTLPDGESADGAEFSGAVMADNDVFGGAGATVGRPSIDVDEQRSVRLLYDDDGTPRVIEGTDHGLKPGLSLGPPFVGSQLAPADEVASASVMNPAGGGLSAWPSVDDEQPAVAVREDFPDGAVQTALVDGGAGGQVGEIAVGRSGLGDGLVAFQQGALGDAAIVAAQVSAPPVASILSVPKGWIRPSQAAISWLPATSADGPLTYKVVLDGRVLSTPAGVLEMRLDPRGLGSGIHQVQVLATDRDDQATLSAPSPLEIDDVPPSVQINRTGGGLAVSVRISDRYSGVDTHAVSVSFGDGHSAAGRAHFRHRYSHAGVYQVVVRVRDNAGVQGTVRRLVSVG